MDKIKLSNIIVLEITIIYIHLSSCIQKKLVNMAACHSFSSTNLWKKQHVQANFFWELCFRAISGWSCCVMNVGWKQKAFESTNQSHSQNPKYFGASPKCTYQKILHSFLTYRPFSIGDIPHIQQLGYLIYTGCQVAKQDAVKDLWLDVLELSIRMWWLPSGELSHNYGKIHHF